MANVEKHAQVWAETLARDIHEAQREPVEKGKTLTRALGSAPYPFIEWEDLPEKAREGRRMQAVYLLKRYSITPKAGGDKDDPKRDGSNGAQADS